MPARMQCSRNTPPVTIRYLHSSRAVSLLLLLSAISAAALAADIGPSGPTKHTRHDPTSAAHARTSAGSIHSSRTTATAALFLSASATSHRLAQPAGQHPTVALAVPAQALPAQQQQLQPTHGSEGATSSSSSSGVLLLQPARQPQQQSPKHTHGQQQQQQQRQQRRLHQQHSQPQEEQTPAQRAIARWYERQRQQQQGLAAPDSPSTAAAAAVDDPEFVIPAPPPGAENPHEVQPPLYSPDQLRLRHKLIPDVPVDSQVISLLEQMQQAEALKVSLTPEQLANANPLLGPKGPVKVPEKTEPEEFPDGYIAICAIVKNQHKDIREWLEYHRWLGVQKVYIYDNNSTVPLTSSITDFLHSGFAEYAFFTGTSRYRDLFRTSSQWWAYNDCVQRFRDRHRWLAFIDADEFIVLQEPQYQRPSWEQQQKQQVQRLQRQQQQQQAGLEGGTAATSNSSSSSSSGTSSTAQDINTFLKQYDQYGGLAVNWVIFGSSSHAVRPHGGVLVNYHACLPPSHEQNTHVKIIANTKYLMTVGDDPHRVYYKDDKHWTVNELGEQVTQARTATPSHTKIALYHYLTKSEHEYMQKMKRGSAAGNYKSPEFFHTINQYATDTCTAAIPLGLKCCPTVLKELGSQGVQQAQQRLVSLQAQSAAGAGDKKPADRRRR